jgi:hypothetical protein
VEGLSAEVRDKAALAQFLARLDIGVDRGTAEKPTILHLHAGEASDRDDELLGLAASLVASTLLGRRG